MERRVVVVSASVGAGHDGAANELARRLRERGEHASVVDFLTMLPFGIGRGLVGFYEAQLRFLPWSYTLIYRLCIWFPPLVAPCRWLIGRLSRRRLLAMLAAERADVVVSTYPLSIVALGELRRRGLLDIPVVAFVTDMAVHPLWVHRSCDLTLCVSPDAATDAARRSGRPAFAPGPLVRPAFTPSPALERAAGATRCALVVGGSWGAGPLVRTVRDLAAVPAWDVLVVCGRNERLRERLEGIEGVRAVGWVDDMAALVAGVDVVVENAGGLTSLEAFASARPVLAYRPIAGHGRANARALERAGVVTYPRRRRDLASALDASLCDRGRATTAAGRALFADDPTSWVLASVPVPVPVPVPVRVPSRSARAVRTGSLVAGSVAAVWLGMTTAVGAAAAAGVGVARPGAPGTLFVGVRVDAVELADPRVRTSLADHGWTAVISGQVAATSPSSVLALRRAGVDLANGGAGDGGVKRWRGERAHEDLLAGATLERISSRPVRTFVPSRRVDGFDLIAAHRSGERVVAAGRALSPTSLGRIGILDVRGRGAAGAVALIEQVAHAAEAQHLATMPLDALR